MTTTDLPVLRRSELDSGHRVERGLVYDVATGVLVALLAPEASSTAAAGAQRDVLDLLDAAGSCVCWTAPAGRVCKALRREQAGAAS